MESTIASTIDSFIYSTDKPILRVLRKFGVSVTFGGFPGARRQVIEGHDVDRGRAEKSELQIVRHDEMIVRSVPSPKRHAQRRLAILLLLLWPKKKEAARSPVFEAAHRSARVDIQ